MSLYAALYSLQISLSRRRSQQDVRHAVLEGAPLSSTARTRALENGVLREGCWAFGPYPTGSMDKGVLPAGGMITGHVQRAGWLRQIQIVSDRPACIDVGTVYYAGLPAQPFLRILPNGTMVDHMNHLVLPGQTIQVTLRNLDHGTAHLVRGWFVVDEWDLGLSAGLSLPPFGKNP